jgi:gamma-glutamyl-gamma-aminobutyrate hydrolase PuuD
MISLSLYSSVPVFGICRGSVLSISRALCTKDQSPLLCIKILQNFSPEHGDLNNKCAAAHGSAFKQRLDKRPPVRTRPMSLFPLKRNDSQVE